MLYDNKSKRQKTFYDEELKPKTFDIFHLPDVYSITLSGVPFVEDITDGSERLLLFTTNENLTWL